MPISLWRNIMNVMLAESTTIEDAKLPTYASPKIDGLRCHVELIDGKPVALSRTNKPLPNKYIHNTFAYIVPYLLRFVALL